MSQNYTLICCLTKTGQDQHLQLGPQSHSLFYTVFCDKEHSNPSLPPNPHANIRGRNSLSPPGTHSFRIPRFPNLRLKFVPPVEGGGKG